MKLLLLAVGRPRDREAGALHDRYASRLGRLGAEYRSAFVAEERPGGRFSDAHVRKREGERLIEALDPRAAVVALDGGGRLFTSEQLASFLERTATREIAFVIGGPLGLDPGVLSRAGLVWSLSPLTFPHELARVLVIEQLYRALCILRGVPYHRGSAGPHAGPRACC